MRFPLRFFLLAVFPAALAAQTPSTPPTTSAPPATPSADALYELGRNLFEQFAPAEIKEQYEFPSKEQWDEFATRLQRSLENNSFEELAAYEPEARAALAGLRFFPDYADYADWLEERLDYIEAAQETQLPPQTTPPSTSPQPPTRPTPARPSPPGKSPPAVRPATTLPHYDLWLRRVQNRPVPPRAHELLPRLRAVFAEEGMPSELVWVAEAESTFNPMARSPVGARGLFQFMPATAQALGLKTSLPDERTHPEKSARAAARYLRELHGKFGNWPLALAAYNGGEGRVRRALKARQADDFAGVASVLPSETRMYVPKVCALITVRTGVTPDNIPPPRRPAG